MPPLLSDPTTTNYLVLVLLAGAAVFYWHRTRDKRSARIALAGAALPIALYLCDTLVESPREEAVRRSRALVAAFNAASPDRVAEQLAERFGYGDTSRATMRSAPVWGLIHEHQVRVAAWDFDRSYVDTPSADEVRIGFMAKVEATASGGVGLFFVRPTFGREADGSYKLRTFVVHTDAMQKANGPVLRVPGLP